MSTIDNLYAYLETETETASPSAAFFACLPSFNIVDGPGQERDLHLGAPTGKAVVGKDGIIPRDFEGAHVALDPKTNVNRTLTRGCVQWASGETTGTFPYVGIVNVLLGSPAAQECAQHVNSGEKHIYFPW